MPRGKGSRPEASPQQRLDLRALAVSDHCEEFVLLRRWERGYPVGQARGRLFREGRAGLGSYRDQVRVNLQEIDDGLESAAEILQAGRHAGSVSSSST